MRAVVQRVRKAQVSIDDKVVGAIGSGYLILVGVGEKDCEADIEKLWSKIYKLRIFSDDEGKTNLSLSDIQGEVLIVSQFTLYANCRKGNRPSFIEAGNPQKAEELYEKFCDRARQDLGSVETGRFG
ncbi:MAG: D-aminoacyl-tRNA deacylase, partial [Eggerthellaceae bacterium]